MNLIWDFSLPFLCHKANTFFISSHILMDLTNWKFIKRHIFDEGKNQRQKSWQLTGWLIRNYYFWFHWVALKVPWHTSVNLKMIFFDIKFLLRTKATFFMQMPCQTIWKKYKILLLLLYKYDLCIFRILYTYKQLNNLPIVFICKDVWKELNQINKILRPVFALN